MYTPLISDDPHTLVHAYPPDVAYGLVERDYEIYPEEMFAPPTDMPLIPESEWDARIDEQESQQSSLEHLYLAEGWENLDQNGQGYCWAYSTTHAVMLLRTASHQPHVRLSAHAIGCKVKGFKNEGGWCGLSAKFHREVGCPSVVQWSEKSMSRDHDKPATWDNAALHKVTEDWVDLTREVYDQNLTFQQIATCLLLNIPVAVDFSWWGHSVCAVRLIRIERGSYGLRILNSWKGWGRRGLGDLQGTKAKPMGAVALRVAGGSVAKVGGKGIICVA